MNIQRAIFATNAFASEYPADHIRLWAQFEQEVARSKRTGYYGADNDAYIKWLREKKDPIFVGFAQNNVQSKTNGS